MERQIDVRKVGQTIKALRHANGLTQDELAGKVGYAIRTIRRIENEGTDSIATVNYFAEIFMVSATDILNGDVFLFLNLYQFMINPKVQSKSAKFN